VFIDFVYHAQLELFKGNAPMDLGPSPIGFNELKIKGTVFSYEPIGDLFRRLVANVRLNGLGNIVAKKIGVGASTGRIGFEPNVGEFNMGKGHVDGNSPTTISITSIDEECRDLPCPISLVKVDVEGFELSVLRGARSMLEMHTPAIVCEYNPHSFSFRDLADAIPYDALYYRIPYTFWEELKPIPDSNLDEPAEILIVPTSRKGERRSLEPKQ